MDITITQFKATCHGVIEKVRAEKSPVTITRHGKPVAELIPVSAGPHGELFGRSKHSTIILGDLLTTGDHWGAED